MVGPELTKALAHDQTLQMGINTGTCGAHITAKALGPRICPRKRHRPDIYFSTTGLFTLYLHCYAYGASYDQKV